MSIASVMSSWIYYSHTQNDYIMSITAKYLYSLMDGVLPIRFGQSDSFFFLNRPFDSAAAFAWSMIIRRGIVPYSAIAPPLYFAQCSATNLAYVELKFDNIVNDSSLYGSDVLNRIEKSIRFGELNRNIFFWIGMLYCIPTSLYACHGHLRSAESCQFIVPLHTQGQVSSDMQNTPKKYFENTK